MRRRGDFVTRYPALMGILLIGAAMLPAQTPERPVLLPAAPPELKAYLNLTDTQVSALLQVQRERAEAERAIHQQMGEKQRALDALLQAGSRDAMQVGQLMIDIAALRKGLPLAGSYRESSLAILTPDQKAKLPALVLALAQQNTAWQAVNWNLIDPPAPQVRPLPDPGQPRLLPMPAGNGISSFQ
jgi:hypothetical protein